MNNSFKEKRTVDSLTGVYTRKYVLDKLQQALNKNTAFTIFMIDLDKFKIINDLQGHHIGDVVLQKVGNRLNTLQNRKIIFGRMGGDEFLAMYYSDDIDQINKTGRQIKDIIRKRIVYDHFEYEVEASIGIARYPEDSDTLSNLLILADYSMYHAKKNNLRVIFMLRMTLIKKSRENKK